MKRSTQALALCAVAAVALGGVVLSRAVDAPGTTSPATAPATRPSGFASRTAFPAASAALPATRPATAAAPTIPAPQPLSDAYKIVVMRTIFSRERARPAWGSGPNGGRPTTQSSQDTRPIIPGSFAASSPESSVALKGVSLEDGLYIAFIEDSFAHETRGLHAGEYVARGQINAMSLDGIEYATGGKILKISIGQTLDGTTLAPSAPASVASGKPAWPAATSGDTGGRDFRPRDGASADAPRDFRPRDGAAPDAPRDFRARDGGAADAPADSRPRDSGGDQRAQSADRGGASDKKPVATEQKSPAPPDQLDSGFDPGAFGPP